MPLVNCYMQDEVTRVFHVLRHRCQNLEGQIRLRLAKYINDPTTLTKYMPLVNYYLQGAGGSLVAVIKTALGIDIPKLLSHMHDTRDQILDVSASATTQRNGDHIITYSSLAPQLCQRQG